MKHIITLLTLSSLVVLAGCTVSKSLTSGAAADQNANNILTVVGEGNASVKPDTAIVLVEVVTLMKENPESSQDKNNAISRSVIDGLISSGVNQDDISTTQYTFRRQERTNSTGQKNFEGWSTVHAFEVVVPFNDLKDRLNHIVIGDEVNIRNVRLQVNDREAAEQTARELAVENAYKKAEDLANVANVQLGDIYDITEGKVRISANQSCTECGGGGPVELEDGTRQLRYYVTIAYSITPAD